jgi:hypothetical protein
MHRLGFDSGSGRLQRIGQQTKVCCTIREFETGYHYLVIAGFLFLYVENKRKEKLGISGNENVLSIFSS